VAIVDVRMPPGNTDDGLVAAIEIRRAQSEVSVLVLSQHLEPTWMLELVGDDASGVGYLLKDRVRDVAEFVDAVERVATRGPPSIRESSTASWPDARCPERDDPLPAHEGLAAAPPRGRDALLPDLRRRHTHLRYEISFGGVGLGVDRVVAAMMRRTVPRGLDQVASAA
jgi:DNA-binding NarL/FixJ family response regulator